MKRRNDAVTGNQETYKQPNTKRIQFMDSNKHHTKKTKESTTTTHNYNLGHKDTNDNRGNGPTASTTKLA